MRGTYRHTVILFDDILELGAKARHASLSSVSSAVDATLT